MGCEQTNQGEIVIMMFYYYGTVEQQGHLTLHLHLLTYSSINILASTTSSIYWQVLSAIRPLWHHFGALVVKYLFCFNEKF